MVAEIKHADLLRLDRAAARRARRRRARAVGRPRERLIVECFEQTVLDAGARARESRPTTSTCSRRRARRPTWSRAFGARRAPYADAADGCRARPARRARSTASASTRALLLDAVDARARSGPPTSSRAPTTPGSQVFTWTLRPENRFLAKPVRRGAPRRATRGDWRARVRADPGHRRRRRLRRPPRPGGRRARRALSWPDAGPTSAAAPRIDAIMTFVLDGFDADPAAPPGTAPAPSSTTRCSRASTRSSARPCCTAGQSLLIVAGAGSGKTSVLTRRIAGLLQTPRGVAEPDPRDHLHQQGRGRDARARRGARRRGGRGHVDLDVPLGVRAHPASRGRGRWA